MIRQTNPVIQPSSLSGRVLCLKISVRKVCTITGCPYSRSGPPHQNLHHAHWKGTCDAPQNLSEQQPALQSRQQQKLILALPPWRSASGEHQTDLGRSHWRSTKHPWVSLELPKRCWTHSTESSLTSWTPLSPSFAGRVGRVPKCPYSSTVCTIGNTGVQPRGLSISPSSWTSMISSRIKLMRRPWR